MNSDWSYRIYERPMILLNGSILGKARNKGKQKVKQYLRTTLNTPILPKTTTKHLQTPEQETKPILTSTNLLDYLQKNESNYLENLESEETKSEPEKNTENKKEMATAYIAKIPEFTSEDNNTTGDANGWNAARMLKAIPYFLQKTAKERFENLEELFEN
ncbi:hypothetical protein G9A89_012128 [Geosiphon pyriformis]|nr:hypothetical protein G9A89_012128 [Geosiphon pyriformis]